ncbi:DNA-binding protein Fis [Actinobacillus equuli]|nr:DNA-binding protein Fis [Actinobacillus equuli]
MLEQQPTQNPLTVSMLNAQAQQVNKPLRDNVKAALKITYLN